VPQEEWNNDPGSETAFHTPLGPPLLRVPYTFKTRYASSSGLKVTTPPINMCVL
jgi:hypothetical protein